MTELVAIPQPYPDRAAFVNIRDYLTNGWAAWTPNEATALIHGNQIVYSIRLRGTNATSWILTPQMPSELLPVGNPFLTAFIDGQPRSAKVQNRMLIIPPESRGDAYPLDVFISTGTLPRRPV